MTSRLIAIAGFATLLLAGNGSAVDPLKSGPQIGARNNRNGFYPQIVAGHLAGERRCPV